MKNLITIILVLFVISGYSQKTKSDSTLQRKWVVKFQPVNLPLYQYSFEAERMLNTKNSVTLGVGIPSSGSLVGKYGIKESDVSKVDLNTMHIRAAFRHYTGNSGLPRGFYIEPYLKYQKVQANATATSIGVENSDANYSADFKADLHTLNAGFQMGTQFLIAKRVAIDFYFFGLEAGILNGNLTATPPSSYVNDMYTKIDQAIHGKPAEGGNSAEKGFPSFLADKLKVTQTDKNVNVKVDNMPYPFLRGGISIGVAF